MFASQLSRIGFLILKQLSRGRRTQCTRLPLYAGSGRAGKSTSLTRSGYTSNSYRQCLQTLFDHQSETKLLRATIFENRYLFYTSSASHSSNEGIEQKEKISVTFVDKDGEEKHIKVPTGMSILEAAHENDIELEGACEGSLACSTCHVIVMDVDYYNKLEDPIDEENDMLDLAFGLTETSRLGCQVIAKPELDGIRLAIPAATRNFAVDGYVPKPH